MYVCMHSFSVCVPCVDSVAVARPTMVNSNLVAVNLLFTRPDYGLSLLLDPTPNSAFTRPTISTQNHKPLRCPVQDYTQLSITCYIACFSNTVLSWQRISNSAM